MIKIIVLTFRIFNKLRLLIKRIIMSFEEITEEIYSLNYDDKLELKTLIEKYLIEDRRNEILAQHQDAIKKAENGELIFSDNTDELLNILDK